MDTAYVRGNLSPKQSYKVQETLQFRYLKCLVIYLWLLDPPCSSAMDPSTCEFGGSLEKRGPWLGQGFFGGDEILPSYIRIIINHEIRVLINQPVSWKNIERMSFFFMAQMS